MKTARAGDKVLRCDTRSKDIESVTQEQQDALEAFLVDSGADLLVTEWRELRYACL